MTAAFDGPDLLVGEIRAVRTFDLRADGSLWPVFAADRPWHPGVNEAHCPRHQPAGAPGCKCGFWAYGALPALRDQPASCNVVAVISCWGRATPGTRGLRAQFAQVDALWLSRRVSPALRAAVAHRYPGVALFRDRRRMLAAHPPTVLAAYRTPIRRPVADVVSRAFLRALVAVMIVLGALTPGVLDVDWVREMRTTALHVLVSTSAAAVVWWVADRLVRRLRRTPATTVLLVVTAVDAWVLAPFQAWWWQVVLRAPLVLVLVPYLANRTVRFLPNPASTGRPG